MQRRARPARSAGHAQKAELPGSAEKAGNGGNGEVERESHLFGREAGGAEQEKATGLRAQPAVREKLVGEDLAIGIGGRKRKIGVERDQRPTLSVGHVVGAKP